MNVIVCPRYVNKCVVYGVFVLRNCYCSFVFYYFIWSSYALRKKKYYTIKTGIIYDCFMLMELIEWERRHNSTNTVVYVIVCPRKKKLRLFELQYHRVLLVGYLRKELEPEG